MNQTAIIELLNQQKQQMLQEKHKEIQKRKEELLRLKEEKEKKKEMLAQQKVNSQPSLTQERQDTAISWLEGTSTQRLSS